MQLCGIGLLTPNVTHSPLADDEEPDIAIYNKELADRGELSWFDAPWLFTECYLCSWMLQIPYIV